MSVNLKGSPLYKFLLKESIKLGIYTRNDFKNKPEKYCGTKITDSPLDD